MSWLMYGVTNLMPGLCSTSLRPGPKKSHSKHDRASIWMGTLWDNEMFTSQKSFSPTSLQAPEVWRTEFQRRAKNSYVNTGSSKPQSSRELGKRWSTQRHKMHRKGSRREEGISTAEGSYITLGKKKTLTEQETGTSWFRESICRICTRCVPVSPSFFPLSDNLAEMSCKPEFL